MSKKGRSYVSVQVAVLERQLANQCIGLLRLADEKNVPVLLNQLEVIRGLVVRYKPLRKMQENQQAERRAAHELRKQVFK